MKMKERIETAIIFLISAICCLILSRDRYSFCMIGINILVSIANIFLMKSDKKDKNKNDEENARKFLESKEGSFLVFILSFLIGGVVFDTIKNISSEGATTGWLVLGVLTPILWMFYGYFINRNGK